MVCQTEEELRNTCGRLQQALERLADRDNRDGGISGYARQIARAALDELKKPPSVAPPAVEQLQLWAWVGEDELGSGETGLKQGYCAAGFIPLVAVRRGKIEKFFPQMEAQAKRYGKRIRLCQFRFVEVVRTTEYGQ